MTHSLSLYLADETATTECGGRLAQACHDTAIIFLYGNLGAGKTTFSRGFLRGLGYVGTVKSPTYTIVEPYEYARGKVYHFDFYRIHDAYELDFIGVQDYFTTGAICLIEWPEQGSRLLPPADLSCYIEPQEQGRGIKLVANSARGIDILKRFHDEN